MARRVTESNPAPRVHRTIILVCGLGMAFAAIGLWKREPKPSPSPITAATPVSTSAEYKRGEVLSKLICSSCHLYTPPDLLDKVTWGMSILPAMAKRLGIHERPYEELRLQPRVIAPPATRDPIIVGLEQFEVIQPEFRGLGETSLVQIDSAQHRIYLGEFHTNDLVVLDPRGHLLSQPALSGPPASLNLRADGMYVTLMGSFMPSERPTRRL